MDSIGFVCDPDHPLFSPIAQRLASRGFDITFLRPTESITRADIDSLSALATGVVHPTSLAALRYADANEIPTWNGVTVTTALSARLVTLGALASVGCRVPDVRMDGPRDGYAAGKQYVWDGSATLDGTGPFYVEQVGTESVDHRYYAVDDGRELHVRAVELQTSLNGDAPLISRTEVDVSRAAGVRELLELFGARAVAVDFTRGTDGAFYALRATPTPTFTGAGMDRRVADSVASLTTIGA